MRVHARVEQLNVYADLASSSLHAAFQHVGYAEFTGHRLQVFWVALVFGCRRTGDDFQIPHSSEFSQNFTLNTIGEISVIGIATQVFERKHGNAFLWRRSKVGPARSTRC